MLSFTKQNGLSLKLKTEQRDLHQHSPLTQGHNLPLGFPLQTAASGGGQKQLTQSKSQLRPTPYPTRFHRHGHSPLTNLIQSNSIRRLCVRHYTRWKAQRKQCSPEITKSVSGSAVTVPGSTSLVALAQVYSCVLYANRLLSCPMTFLPLMGLQYLTGNHNHRHLVLILSAGPFQTTSHAIYCQLLLPGFAPRSWPLQWMW